MAMLFTVPWLQIGTAALGGLLLLVLLKRKGTGEKCGVKLLVLNHKDGSEYNESVVQMLGELFSACGARGVTFEERPAAEVSLRDVVKFDGVVVAGGSLSGPSEEPHAVATRQLLLALHAEGFPTLALCFGHQALAVAMGGRVAEHKLGFQAGPAAFRCGQLGPRILGCSREGEAVLMPYVHDHVVTRLPPGAQALSHAETPYVFAAAYWLDRKAALTYRAGGGRPPHLVSLQGRPELATPTGEPILRRILEASQRDEAWIKQRVSMIGSPMLRKSSRSATKAILSLLWPTMTLDDDDPS